VAAEKNSTLVLPFPVELLRFLERSTPAEPGSTPAARLDDISDDIPADPAIPPALAPDSLPPGRDDPALTAPDPDPTSSQLDTDAVAAGEDPVPTEPAPRRIPSRRDADAVAPPGEDPVPTEPGSRRTPPRRGADAVTSRGDSAELAAGRAGFRRNADPVPAELDEPSAPV
jgi:hypothetical protein